MNCVERREKFEQYSAELEQLFDPTSFVLNPEIEQIQTKISLLKQTCMENYCAGCATCALGGNK